MADKIKVTVWNEYRHEIKPGIIQMIYPKGIHETIVCFQKYRRPRALF